MPSLFYATLQGLGLSQSEAAAFLGVRLDTVKSWCQGRRTPPAGAWAQLHELAGVQDRAARELVQAARDAVTTGAVIELSVANDDAEAQALGWPCVAAQLATFRRAWEMLPTGAQIEIVPRGSTPASKAAIGARHKIN